MGLDFKRDRLCLVQISDGDDHAHLVQILKKRISNLSKFLKMITLKKFFILLDLILQLFKKFKYIL